MASKLDDLIRQLQGSTTAYKPLTNEQMRRQATTRYQSQYDQSRLAARQGHDTNAAALDRQLTELGATYDKQREESKTNYRNAYADKARSALGTGMQRASYTNASLANINLAGNKAQQAINDNQTQSEQSIAGQKTQLAQQLASQLAQYDASQKADELGYMDQLSDREYNRQSDSTKQQRELAMKMYEYQHQLEQEAEDRNRWQAMYG